MKEITISYNSFGPLTDVKMDGTVLKTHSDEAEFVAQHRQIAVFDWLGNLVDLLLRKYRSDLKVSFVGTQDDCETFKSVIKDIAHMQGNGSVQLGTVEASLPDPLTALDGVYKKGKEGPFPEIFQEQSTEDAYKKATSRAFEVSVVAAMSSGKSTLMNALLGCNLMPSAADACTATIVRITDTDSMKGQPFVAVRYSADGDALDKKPIPVTNEDLISWNNDKNIPHVEIMGDVPTISETPSSQYVFQDTPGPNNAMDQSHGEMTNRAIEKDLSMVLYVMTPDTFQGNDNDNIFQKVCREVKKSDENARNRFVFVLNKMDAVKAKEQSTEDVYKKACEYLESRGIHNPIVIPVCARAACLIRLHRFDESFFNGNDDDLDEYETSVRKFARPAWSMYELCKGSLSASVQSKYEKRIAAARSLADDGEPEELALLQTGIPLLETLLQEYLFRYALPTKVGNALKKFKRVFDEADKTSEVKKFLSQSEQDLKKAEKALADFNESKENLLQGENIIQKIQKMQYVISDESKDRLEDLSAEYQTELDAVEKSFGSGKLGLSDADRKIERARTRLDELVDRVKDELTAILAHEQETKIAKLIEEYNSCLKKYLGPLAPNLREFQSDMLSISSEDILQSAKNNSETQIAHPHYARHWYTLWLVEHDETTYEDAIDMGNFSKEIMSELSDFCRSAIAALKKQAVESFKKNQKTVCDRMAELQEELGSTMQMIHEAAQGKSNCKKICDMLQEKLDWCDDFQQELSGVLMKA